MSHFNKHKQALFCFLLIVSSGLNTLWSQNGSSDPCGPVAPPQVISLEIIPPGDLLISWEPPAATLEAGQQYFYHLVVVDSNSQNIVLDIVIPETSYTLPNLIPGHTYCVTVNTSSCKAGPFSTDGKVQCIRFPDIVIDYIVQNSCTSPRSSFYSSIDDPYKFSIPISQVGDNHASFHMMIFDFLYLNSSIRISVWVQKPGIYPLLHMCQNYSENADMSPPYDPIGDTDLITYKYNSSTFSPSSLFTIEYDYQSNIGTIKFLENDIYIEYCNSEATNGAPTLSLTHAPSNPNAPTKTQKSTELREDTYETSTFKEQTLAINPNPTTGDVSAQYTLSAAGTVSFDLMDLAGKLVKHYEINQAQEPGDYSTTIETADLAPGMYLLTMKTDQGRKVVKVCKQ